MIYIGVGCWVVGVACGFFLAALVQNGTEDD